jgi:hypothetical protein
MGRGLGRMQRTVLECLEPAKAAHARGELDYRGGSTGWFGENSSWRREAGEPPLVAYRGRTYELGRWYDLRATLLYAAITDRKARRANGALMEWDVDPVFRVGFCRAVRALVRRGLLTTGAPVRPGREIRFVRRPEDGSPPSPSHTRRSHRRSPGQRRRASSPRRKAISSACAARR